MTRFTSECDMCAELLTEYITASNTIVEAKQELQSPKQPSSRQLASALIDRALKRRTHARKQLLTHKEQQH